MAHNIDVIVLAGGTGARLEPLTLREKGSIRTKGMVGICGQRPMSVIFGAMNKLGLDHNNQIIVVAKGSHNRSRIISTYRRQTLEYIPIKVSFPIDDYPDAGSGDATLMNINRFEIKKDVLVCPNDCFLNGLHLDKLERTNKNANALATIVAYEVSAFEAAEKYGVMITDDKGIIKSFMEKPKLDDLMTQFNIQSIEESKNKKVLVSTGFYYLKNEIKDISNTEGVQNMRKSGKFDFGKDFFPWLVKNNYRVNVHKVNNFYDMGNIESYMETGLDIIKGKVEWIDYVRNADMNLYDHLSYNAEKNIYISKESLDFKINILGKEFPTLRESINKGYITINKNVLIDDIAMVLPGCILENCYIGEMSTIGQNSVIKGTEKYCSTIYLTATIGEGTEITDSIICTAANVNHKNIISKDDTYSPDASRVPRTIIKNSVVGDASVIDEGAEVYNTKVYPSSYINKDSKLFNIPRYESRSP